MSAKSRKPGTKEQIITELWEQTGAHSAGASELEQIGKALLERFGTGASESPASIARALADHGVPLQHPDILEADFRWRQEQMTALFSYEELNLTTIAAAVEWVEKLDSLQRKFEQAPDASGRRLRQFVVQFKNELELAAARKKATESERQLAREVAQWLRVWLQNPPIFREWLALRRATAEFQERFE